MYTCEKIGPSSFATSWLVLSFFLIAGGFCGCSTVEPELTSEERVYNQQLKEQGEDHGPSETDDLNVAQKIVYYTEWPLLIVLKGLAEGHYSFSP
jgi:hypothetical protein